MAALIPQGALQFTDANGVPLVGGSVAYTQPGTGGTQFRPIYGDEAETVPLTNPVPLNAGGWPYSGGSQQVVWGFGQYELFARDGDGNLIWTAVVDTPGGLTGGTINGSVQINGDLSVVGNITDTQSLSTPLANITQLNATNANVGGALGVGGNVTAGGFITPGYVVATTGVDTGILNANDGTLQHINLMSSTIWGDMNFNWDAGVSNATHLNGGWPQTMGGLGETDSTGHIFVPISPSFPHGVASVVVGLIGGPGVGDVGPIVISATNITTSGFDVYSEVIDVTAAGPGTGTGNGEGGNGGGPGTGGTAPGRLVPRPLAPRSTGVSMIFGWIAIGN